MLMESHCDSTTLLECSCARCRRTILYIRRVSRAQTIKIAISSWIRLAGQDIDDDDVDDAVRNDDAEMNVDDNDASDDRRHRRTSHRFQCVREEWEEILCFMGF